MRTARVFYLFLSVLQFIFFLKLVEYVRGEEIETKNRTNAAATVYYSQAANPEDRVRGLFIAPKMKRKKLSSWNNGKSENVSQIDSQSYGGAPFVEDANISSEGSNSTVFQSKREQYEKEVARLCPACQNNECVSVSPISAGFPIVPVIIAVITGIAWFILFLIAWIFHTRPNTKGQASGGYGGGYGSPENEYGDDSDEKPSIFDHFLKPHDRSLRSYTQLLNNVLDSIGKLSDLYNSY